MNDKITAGKLASYITYLSYYVVHFYLKVLYNLLLDSWILKYNIQSIHKVLSDLIILFFSTNFI